MGSGPGPPAHSQEPGSRRGRRGAGQRNRGGGGAARAAEGGCAPEPRGPRRLGPAGPRSARRPSRPPPHRRPPPPAASPPPRPGARPSPRPTVRSPEASARYLIRHGDGGFPGGLRTAAASGRLNLTLRFTNLSLPHSTTPRLQGLPLRLASLPLRTEERWGRREKEAGKHLRGRPGASDLHNCLPGARDWMYGRRENQALYLSPSGDQDFATPG